MKEISKKDLVSLVTENQFDIDEMGYNPRFVKTKSKEGRLERGEGKPKFDPVTGKEIPPKASRVQDLHHPTLSPLKVDKKTGQPTNVKLPMAYVVNTSREYGKGTIIVAVGQSTEEELMKNPEFTEWFEDVIVPKIGKQTPDNTTVHFVDFIKEGASHSNPEYLQKAGEELSKNIFDKTGVDLQAGIGTKHLKPEYYLKLAFRPPMEEFMSSVQERLFMMGFPPINYPTQDPGHQKRGFNTHATFDSEDCLFQSHSIYTYDNYPEFRTKALELIKLNNLPEGEEKSIEISDAEYQARQYNAGVNWTIEKKQIKTGDEFKKNPLTKVYKLDRRGMKAEEKDYLTNTEFSMKGDMLPNNQYQWQGEVTLEISEKLREETGGQLKPYVVFSASGTTDYSEGITYDNDRSVLDNPKVMRVLKAVFQNIVSQIMQYDPIPQLKERVFKTRDQVTKMKMNESEIRELVKSVIKEGKGGEYETYHNTYTSAIRAAKAYAEKKGYEINDDESFRKIGMGPKKPDEGKTNRFSIELSKDGKVQKKQLHIQVYGMKSKYELNAYIS